MAARRSSVFNCEYSFNIFSSVATLASKSKIKETQIWVPRIQGFPKHTFGLIVILSSNGFMMTPLQQDIIFAPANKRVVFLDQMAADKIFGAINNIFFHDSPQCK